MEIFCFVRPRHTFSTCLLFRFFAVYLTCLYATRQLLDNEDSLIYKCYGNSWVFLFWHFCKIYCMHFSSEKDLAGFARFKNKKLEKPTLLRIKLNRIVTWGYYVLFEICFSWKTVPSPQLEMFFFSLLFRCLFFSLIFMLFDWYFLLPKMKTFCCTEKKTPRIFSGLCLKYISKWLVSLQLPYEHGSDFVNNCTWKTKCFKFLHSVAQERPPNVLNLSQLGPKIKKYAISGKS